MLTNLDNDSQLSILLFLPLISRLALRTTCPSLQQQIDRLQTTTSSLAVSITKKKSTTDVNLLLQRTSHFLTFRSSMVLFWVPPQPFAFVRNSITSNCIQIDQLTPDMLPDIIQLSITKSEHFEFIRSLVTASASQQNPLPRLECVGFFFAAPPKSFVTDFRLLFGASPLRHLMIHSLRVTFPGLINQLSQPNLLETVLHLEEPPKRASGEEILAALHRTPQLRHCVVMWFSDREFLQQVQKNPKTQIPECFSRLEAIPGFLPEDISPVTVAEWLPNLKPKLSSFWLVGGIRTFAGWSEPIVENLGLVMEKIGQGEKLSWLELKLNLGDHSKLLESPESGTLIDFAREKYPMSPDQANRAVSWSKEEWLAWAACVVFVSVDTVVFGVTGEEKMEEWSRAVILGLEMKEERCEDGQWRREEQLELFNFKSEIPERLKRWCMQT
jgi:hypothetical protein